MSEWTGGRTDGWRRKEVLALAVGLTPSDNGYLMFINILKRRVRVGEWTTILC